MGKPLGRFTPPPFVRFVFSSCSYRLPSLRGPALGELPPFCVSRLKPRCNWLSGIHSIPLLWLFFFFFSLWAIAPHKSTAERAGDTSQSHLDPVRQFLVLQGTRADAIGCIKELHQNPIFCSSWRMSWMVGIYIGLRSARKIDYCTRALLATYLEFCSLVSPFSPTSTMLSSQPLAYQSTQLFT